MTTTSGPEEDFPLLPVKKQEQCTYTSRRSSVSSVSSLALTAQTEEVENELYYSDEDSYEKESHTKEEPKPWFLEVVQEAVCRRHVFCKCAQCTRHSVLNKRKWNDLTRYPCDEATILYQKDLVKVIHMKSYGKRGESRVFVFTEDFDGTTIQGWVHPDCLGGMEAVRSALEAKKLAEALKQLKKDFERLSTNPVEEPVQRQKGCKPVARFVPEPVAPKHKYQYKELVLARDALGQPWYRAEVVSTNPLTLKKPEWKSGLVYDERNVKSHPTSNFVAVRAMEVRTTEHPRSFVKKTLPKGTVVGVVQMNGHYARISSPECGWVQMRSSDALYAVEQNYQFKLVNPKLFLGGLPAGANRTNITLALQQASGGVILPSSLHIFRQGDNLCAYLNLTRPSSYARVVNKTIRIDGQNVTCEWCINYLRSKAARELRRK